jgi:hypothetical protein
MNKGLSLAPFVVAVALVLSHSVLVSAQEPTFLMPVEMKAATNQQSTIQGPLTNADVVGMVKAGLNVDIIIAKIKVTSCSFDTSPTTLKELKDAGVPDSVILAMVQARR